VGSLRRSPAAPSVLTNPRTAETRRSISVAIDCGQNSAHEPCASGAFPAAASRRCFEEARLEPAPACAFGRYSLAVTIGIRDVDFTALQPASPKTDDCLSSLRGRRNVTFVSVNQHQRRSPFKKRIDLPRSLRCGINVCFPQ
jgi:hypothetical protein